ncbi:hypothetical protein [Roseobacter sp. CCS2]|uniref:hypothetical protein n=1 Tax=Roseobacter sp. CCS2 TaxID=391593 RepID=UPI0000F3F159|nr:hypothetical protein [Roseobacter sp. CCS2]EBA11139.1 hypothetical protein RCCS2_10220 [Roseobacter sp. CCS2]
MAEHTPKVQYPELKGSEQHFDLKNDPGKKGDPDHASDDDLNADNDEGIVSKTVDKIKSKFTSGSDN